MRLFIFQITNDSIHTLKFKLNPKLTTDIGHPLGSEPGSIVVEMPRNSSGFNFSMFLDWSTLIMPKSHLLLMDKRRIVGEKCNSNIDKLA